MLHAAWSDWNAANGHKSTSSAVMPRPAISFPTFIWSSCGGAGPLLLAVIAVVMTCTLGDIFV